MTSSSDSGAHDVDIPPESTLLKKAYKTAGVTAADLAAATGLSTGSVHIAMNGVRYRDGKAMRKVPPDDTLIKLSAVLHVHPDALRSVGRERAAGLLEEATADEDGPERKTPTDLEAQAAAYGRAALARQVLGLFSDEELQAELERRDRAQQEQEDRETKADLIATLKADQGAL